DDDLVPVFWEQVKLIKDEPARRLVLAPLVSGGDARAALFLSRSLRGRCPVRAETLTWLLETAGALRPGWTDFRGREDHLGHLREVLRDQDEGARTIWDSLCAQLDRGLLVHRDPHQSALLSALGAVKRRPGPALPALAAQVIDDWALLREHFDKACAAPESEWRQVLEACRRLRLDPLDALREYFARFVLPQEVRPELLDDFAGFFHNFYPQDDESQDHAARLLGWLAVSACPDESRRAAYQRYYLDKFVPVAFRERLAEEAYRAGNLLPEGCPALPADSLTPRDEGE